MVSAAFSLLLAALGVTHASESCADIDHYDIDYFLSTTAQEISCALLLSVGQCGCYVYAGEDGMSNWINATSVRASHSAGAGAGPATRRATRAPTRDTGAIMPCSHAHQRR